MSFSRYESYKESGVEWLGDVPEHWEVKRLRFIAQLNPSKSETTELDRETEVSFLPMEAIGDDGSLNLERTRPIGEVETGYTYFREGDVTIAKITPCFENGKGAVMRGLFGGIGFGTTELIVARAKPFEATSNYLHWLFISTWFRKHGEASMYGAGGQKRVPDDFVRDFTIALPAILEQQAIAAFLDRETAKIDALIAEQQRLIELLKEKRQAVISYAVTKGLNPNAPMKDSGIEWLGEVPKHWEVLKGGAIGRIFGSEQVSEKYVKDEGELPFIKVGSLSLNDFEIEMWNWFVDPGIASQYKAKSNFIVFPKRGAAIFTNKVNIVEIPSVIDPNLMGWEMGEKVFVKFFAYVLKSRRLDELADVSTIPQINNKHINPEKFPVPPLHEQQTITSFLDNETAKIDALTAEAKTAITLLQERRTALISATVTGKIDVRGAGLS
ncbi:MAG: restriction endonuclease subunit S [Nitrosomonas sp.]|nr:restriction endonuclease subunit S [Nitrosomonas sp.]